jgi:hypothetical protein
MNAKADFCIDVAAAKALVRWKSLFADEVAESARRLAASESGRPQRITLSHYRQAAQSAMHKLAAAILEGGTGSDDQKAA